MRWEDMIVYPCILNGKKMQVYMLRIKDTSSVINDSNRFKIYSQYGNPNWYLPFFPCFWLLFCLFWSITSSVFSTSFKFSLTSVESRSISLAVSSFTVRFFWKKNYILFNNYFTHAVFPIVDLNGTLLDHIVWYSREKNCPLIKLYS